MLTGFIPKIAEKIASFWVIFFLFFFPVSKNILKKVHQKKWEVSY